MSLIAGVWALLYALYRGYYGLGGTVGMIGTPTSWSDWRRINLVGTAILLVAAALPIVAIPLWRRPRMRQVLLGLCWVAAVACVGHALIQDVQRVVSLAGIHHIHYSASEWASVNGRGADIQDLAFNETWFFVEGLLWAAIAWIALGRSSSRRLWVLTAGLAVAMATAIGLLSAFGVIGRIIVG